MNGGTGVRGSPVFLCSVCGGSCKNTNTIFHAGHKVTKRDRARGLGSPFSVFHPTKRWCIMGGKSKVSLNPKCHSIVSLFISSVHHAFHLNLTTISCTPACHFTHTHLLQMEKSFLQSFYEVSSSLTTSSRGFAPPNILLVCEVSAIWLTGSFLVLGSSFSLGLWDSSSVDHDKQSVQQ